MQNPALANKETHLGKRGGAKGRRFWASWDTPSFPLGEGPDSKAGLSCRSDQGALNDWTIGGNRQVDGGRKEDVAWTTLAEVQNLFSVLGEDLVFLFFNINIYFI